MLNKHYYIYSANNGYVLDGSLFNNLDDAIKYYNSKNRCMSKLYFSSVWRYELKKRDYKKVGKMYIKDSEQAGDYMALKQIGRSIKLKEKI